MLVKIFSENVKKYRIVRGYSQEVLAERSGLHRTYIAGIETVTRNVSLKNIEKIAQALDIPPALLFVKEIENVE